MLRENWKFLLVLLVILLGITAYGLWEQTRVRPRSAITVNIPAPELTLQKIAQNGALLPETFRLDDLRGSWVILNFWTSWCVECRKEVDVLNAFHRTIQEEDLPIRILGVNVWDTPSGIRAFLRTYPMAFLNGRDLSGTAGARYGLTGVPETFLVDPEGVIRDHVLGPVSWTWLEGVRNLVEGTGASDRPASHS